MSTPNYPKKISELKERVEKHTKISNHGGTVNNITSIISIFTTKSILFYIIPSIVLIIFFLIVKPSFVCFTHTDIDTNIIIYSLNYKKVLIYGLISGTIISISLFAYFKK